MVEERSAAAGRCRPFVFARRGRALCAGLVLLLTSWTSVATAQTRTVPITGDRLSGFVLPVEPVAGDLDIQCRRAWAWTVDDTKRLVLEGDVSIQVGSYRLVGPRAVLWINRLPSADGLINQFAAYFDEIGDPTARAGLGVSGKELLVTGSTRGTVRVRATLLERRRPPAGEFRRQAEQRLAEHLKLLLVRQPRLSRLPVVERPIPPEEFRPVPGGTLTPEDLALPTEVTLPTAEEDLPWLTDATASIRFSFPGTLEGPRGTDEFAYLATGGILVEYVSRNADDRFRRLSLTAERAVIFTDPVPLRELPNNQLGVDVIRGVYLEGNVIATADDDTYVVRAPQVYYDFRRDQAIMLEAVLRTYSRLVRLPVYARARELRQIARNQWEAERVQVSTSEFFSPHLSIGAAQMTITQQPTPDDADAPTETFVDARNATLKVGELPLLTWPRLAGTVRDIPLRGVRMGTADNDGVQIETRWDLSALLGTEPTPGLDAELRLDGYTKRGAGGGIKLDLSREFGTGEIDLYGLFDEGEDRTSSGQELEPAREFRGVALLEHQADLGRHWLLQSQVAFISDETFITSWREDDFRDRREFETSLYLKNQRESGAFTLLLKDSLNDFISNDYLLASRQYTVDRLPELTLRTYGESWFDDTITYSAETRVSRMNLAFDERSPLEHGIRTTGLSMPGQDFDVGLRTAGLSSQSVLRLDSRHELSRPTKVGIFHVTPFLVGRLTAWDEDHFESFSAQSDDVRVFGAAGLRVYTQFHHVDNTVENRALDLHRLRHIIEPSITVWYGYSDVSDDDLPEYDPEVESIGTGTVTRIGLRNTWQTQRGGPGHWRSVDVLLFDADVVFHSDDFNRESPTPQYFEYRPEYSQFGDHVRAAAVWLLSDHLSLLGEATYDLETDVVARSSIGAELTHSPLLSTYVEYRSIDVSDNQLLDVGWDYQITKKYRLRLGPQWDFRENEFRSIRADLTRHFPDFDFIVRVRHDEIRNDTRISASIGLAEF